RPEALVEMVGEHGFCAVDGLLRRLADEHYGSVPAALFGGESAGDSDHGGDVDVVAAGVHDADILTCSILRLNRAGVGNSSLLDDWEGVEIGADEQRGAVAVLEDRDNS